MALKKLASFLIAFAVLSFAISEVWAYDASRTDNIVVYYGQNSVGATNPDKSVWQKSLSTYCQDDTINIIPLAFLNVFFSTGGLPEINLANTCSSESGVFPGTSLANCQSMAADIKACQARGKLVTISLGGATGAAGFSSEPQAQQFATMVWNIFLGGSSSTRPFGDAVLDGVDLDIEGGSGAYFPSFVNKITSLANGSSKKYWFSAAPQCPFPDAYLGTIINAVGFDAIYVQFYNNWCSLPNYSNVNAWNFGDWDNWAKTTSPNKNVKIFIGAPASSTAAGSGYVDAGTLSRIVTETRSKYSSFGGVMFWDASQVFGNGRIDMSVKAALNGGGGTTNPPTTTTKPTTTPPTTTPSSSGNCAGVAAWSPTIAYQGKQQVTYKGHLWTAQWWSQNDIPGGGAGVWIDNGVCKSKITALTTTGGVTPSSVVDAITPATAMIPTTFPKSNDGVAPYFSSDSVPQTTTNVVAQSTFSASTALPTSLTVSRPANDSLPTPFASASSTDPVEALTKRSDSPEHSVRFAKEY